MSYLELKIGFKTISISQVFFCDSVLKLQFNLKFTITGLNIQININYTGSSHNNLIM